MKVVVLLLFCSVSCAQVSNTLSLKEAREARREYVTLLVEELDKPVADTRKLATLQALLTSSDARIDELAEKVYEQNYEQAKRDWDLARDILQALGIVGAVAAVAF